MLGGMVTRLLRKSGHKVTAVRRGDGGFDASTRDGVETLRNRWPLDAVINCVAITRLLPLTSATLDNLLTVNSVLPWRLSDLVGDLGGKLVHISSDAVFRGGPKPLFEDDPCDADEPYGLSKRLGEPTAAQALSVRCSIVGPETNPRGHLLEWLLRHPDGSVIDGHVDRVWSGATTLQLARFCRTLVEGELFGQLRERAAVVHFAPNAPLTKYELLKTAAQVYGRKIEVRPVDSGRPVERVLQSRSAELIGARHPLPFSAALAELRAAVSLQP